MWNYHQILSRFTAFHPIETKPMQEQYSYGKFFTPGIKKIKLSPTMNSEVFIYSNEITDIVRNIYSFFLNYAG